jgi:hypothetical protein
MDYLTNYYKNLCEQLQVQVSHLENLIENIRSPVEILNIGREEHKKAIQDEERRLGRYLTSKESDKLLDTVFTPYAKRAAKRRALVDKAIEELPSVAQTGDVEAARAITDVMHDMNAPSLLSGGSEKQAGYSDIPEPARGSILKLKQEHKEIAKKLRGAGISTTVAPDIAAMRTFIEMGKGRYKAPFPEPEK